MDEEWEGGGAAAYRVEDEDIAAVERRGGTLDLLDAALLEALDVQQHDGHRVHLRRLEGGLDAALDVRDSAAERRAERRRLVALHDAVLHGRATEHVVQILRGH